MIFMRFSNCSEQNPGQSQVRSTDPFFSSYKKCSGGWPEHFCAILLFLKKNLPSNHKKCLIRRHMVQEIG